MNPTIGQFFRGDPNLQAYYDLSRGEADYSGNGRNGSVVGGRSLATIGKNVGYRFDTSQTSYVNLPKNFPSDLAYHFTFMSWIYPEKNINENNYIIDLEGQWWVSYQWLSDKQQVDFRIYDGSSTQHVQTPAGSAPVGQLMLVTATFSSDYIRRIYINDVCREQDQMASYLRTGPNDYNAIGNYGYSVSAGYTFGGTIFESAIFDREVTGQEISQYYNAVTKKNKKLFSLYYEAPATSNALFFGTNF